jgi:hypothetical protein
VALGASLPPVEADGTGTGGEGVGPAGSVGDAAVLQAVANSNSAMVAATVRAESRFMRER